MSVHGISKLLCRSSLISESALVLSTFVLSFAPVDVGVGVNVGVG